MLECWDPASQPSRLPWLRWRVTGDPWIDLGDRRRHTRDTSKIHPRYIHRYIRTHTLQYIPALLLMLIRAGLRPQGSSFPVLPPLRLPRLAPAPLRCGGRKERPGSGLAVATVGLGGSIRYYWVSLVFYGIG
ncbi:hypothetical protein I7I48_02187 [Histoplasma ohiense]|nr:hypothetical protein I7I48_02187 [Histoplasma ohiense (nom. inval.)]